MQTTAYAEINELLDSLLAQIQHVLDQKLVGVYLYGSLVWGDFDQGSSDIDLVVATASDIEDQEFSDLDQMQLAFVEAYKRWEGRIEIVYVSTAALQTFKSCNSKIAVISPGEPFHFKEADQGWLMN
jgi:predicted nucleotidyltransferase